MLHCQDDRSELRLIAVDRLWLFLDYDGTIAEFAETPDQVEIHPEVVDLLSRLVRLPGVRVTIVSGRRLEHIRKLVPVPGILLAGIYGIESFSFEGEEIQRLDTQTFRPVLEKLKPQLQQLISGKKGFFLEDKGWSLALHAKFAPEHTSEQVLQSALQILSEGNQSEDFIILGGHKFLEICPRAGNKGETVRYFLLEYPWPGALLAYVGDDDKDEEAFKVIHEQRGVTIRVGPGEGDTKADCSLENPEATRRWLDNLIQRRENGRITQ